MSLSPDTIAALATPAGTSAIAVVRASGPRVAELTTEIFGSAPPPRTAQHADYRDLDGQLVDDVLYIFFASPNSYTGEDTLEISCHGNPYIAQRILEDLLHRGCRPAEAGEFTKRAFLGGRMDLSQAEAVMDLIGARSERALAVANQQLRGSLGRSMDRLVSILVDLLARIEAYIDFPDEDLPPEDREEVLRQLDELTAATAKLVATSRYGEMLREGIRAVIVGEPNAGKSSLLNRLLGRDRALVSPEPGTTRDYLEESIGLGPHLLRLVDTAGLNPNPAALESRGIEKSLEQAKGADLLLWVIDSTGQFPIWPSALPGLGTPANTIIVFNKCDLARPARPTFADDFRSVEVSALTGTGIDRLNASITKFAESFRNSTGDETIAINVRHADALRRAVNCLASARTKVVTSQLDELLASDLREVLDAFGEVTGRIDDELVLDRLFSVFCIGK